MHPASPSARGPLAAALLMAALGVVGCGRSTARAPVWRDVNPLPADTMTVPMPTPGTHGGTFVIAQTSSPKTFNPFVANETSSTDITNRLFVSLTDVDNLTQADLPLLARSWERAPDGCTWTFHLRRGAAFSDGRPMTAVDVLFSFEVAYDDTLHPTGQDLLKMGGRKFELSAPDSHTIVLRTPAPNPLLLPIAGSVRILPRHVLEPVYRAGRFASAYSVGTPPESIVTSGPWTIRRHAAGERTVLARNPHWFGVDARGLRLPYLDELVFLVVPDQDAADLKFRAGEVDALDNVKPENYRWYEEHQREGGYTLHDLGPGLNTNFLWFNLNRVRAGVAGRREGETWVDAAKYSWFARPEFRRAVSMAIDRDAMIPSVFFGAGVKTWSTATPGNLRWHTPDVTRYDHDPEGARRLLAGLGWRDRDGDGVLEDERGRRVSFTLKTNSDNRLRIAMANFARDDLAKVGIEVNLVPVEFNALITNLRDDFQYEAILLGLQSGVPPDPGMGQNTWRSSGRTHYWNSRQPAPETPEEARIDRLMDTIASSLDHATRMAAWREIQNIVNEQCWFIWLPTLELRIPVRDRFGNVQPSVIPHRVLWNIDRVYVLRDAAGA